MMLPAEVLARPKIRSAILQAWRESKSGLSSGHEEGGFIFVNKGDVHVTRWPAGGTDTILLPGYANGKVGDDYIVATFHTHPNTGSNYLQEPSETDKMAVRDDEHLKSEFYIGEFVISQKIIYLITPYGFVSEIGRTDEILFEEV